MPSAALGGKGSKIVAVKDPAPVAGPLPNERVLSLFWIKDRIEHYSDYDEPETEKIDLYRFDSLRKRLAVGAVSIPPNRLVRMNVASGRCSKTDDNEGRAAG